MDCRNGLRIQNYFNIQRRIKEEIMSFKYIREISTPQEILDSMPLSQELNRLKKERDQVIKGVFTRENNLFLLIIGPCSAHDEDAVCDYISRLARVQETVKEKILIIPRIYTNKPRTNGMGYKGMVHQPDPQQEPNIVEGIQAIRRLHIRAIRESGLPAADEMLYPGNYPYLEDVLSYVAVGARSVENQAHRLTCSGLEVPVGMKNPTSGDQEVTLEFHTGLPGLTCFQLQRLGGKDHRESSDPCRPAGGDRSLQDSRSQLPLRRLERLCQGLSEARLGQPDHHRGYQSRQLQQKIHRTAPDRQRGPAQPQTLSPVEGYGPGIDDREFY